MPNALRRHQKSRHNGVVIEPSEKDDADDDGSSGTQSKSRSATPSTKGKEKAHQHPPPAPYPAPTTTRSGPSSYYRQHTLTTGPYVPRQLIMDPNYAQVGLPTSATRLNLATHWGYPHPWPDGAAPQQMSYQHMYYAPHYRPNGTDPTPGSIPLPSAQDPSNTAAQQPTVPRSCPPQGTADTKQAGTEAASGPATDETLSIDPSLDPHESTELTAEQIMQITEALLQEPGEHSSGGSRDGSASTTAFSETHSGSQDEHDANNGKSHVLHGYGLPLVRPEPMEHMLTEDGEPMLNPAELLTQESLASPPPS
ncbi:hypothetical protein DXG01_002135 [Tephrocybe rancida]|nr:hypothetical protein DXG01_002135 [Tephrocybe rancida]